MCPFLLVRVPELNPALFRSLEIIRLLLLLVQHVKDLFAIDN